MIRSEIEKASASEAISEIRAALLKYIRVLSRQPWRFCMIQRD